MFVVSWYNKKGNKEEEEEEEKITPWSKQPTQSAQTIGKKTASSYNIVIIYMQLSRSSIQLLLPKLYKDDETDKEEDREEEHSPGCTHTHTLVHK